MKRFDTFGAYMFDLLFAPLKRGKRAANQFFIFFKVIGRIFDGMKKDAFRLRDELNVATASPVMLPVHGQDRDMPRLEGESIENYRARLWATFEMEDSEVEWLRNLLSADTVIMRFEGTDYSKFDYTWTGQDRQAITDIIDLYNLLKAVTPEVREKALRN